MTLPQNKRLEELFDLPESGPDTANTKEPTTEHFEIKPETLSVIDKIESALPAVRGLEASDAEMDDLAGKATESYDDLMNLGMQVDSRYASEIFSVASQMLGHAITAKTAKLNKKLKMIDLQLKKAGLDQRAAAAAGDTAGLETAQGRVLDRNDLLKTLLERDPEKSKLDK